ncbi:MAG: glutamate-5-semialdehyde dehydrogenase [Clostridia bacterium]|nr:glutamate-5-semialdehyde dehydrogenase [Clostridia bacterium]
MTTIEIIKAARAAWPSLKDAESPVKDKALACMADALISRSGEILSANQADLEAARGSISDVMLDRLALTEKRIRSMADGIRDVIALPDPCGVCLDSHTRPDGLQIEKISSPIGVVAIIYESRPNVTSDAAALAIKSGNACVLRCGKEAFRSANAITDALKAGLEAAGLSGALVGLVQDTTRQSARDLMTATGLVDLLIPRGGAGLIKACTENAQVPCIETGTGICHIYVHARANVDMALNIIDNAKTSRPSVCNAAEVCLVDREIAAEFLPRLQDRLVRQRAAAGLVPVELRLDREAASLISGTAAGPADFDTEFLDYILAVKTVGGLDEAISHIAAHSTGHSDAIISEDVKACDRFVKAVDSAAVYVNASTRFTDGGEFGLGCEIGISTQKLHARGPMGLRELTTYKYVVHGNGQVR